MILQGISKASAIIQPWRALAMTNLLCNIKFIIDFQSSFTSTKVISLKELYFFYFTTKKKKNHY